MPPCFTILGSQNVHPIGQPPWEVQAQIRATPRADLVLGKYLATEILNKVFDLMSCLPIAGCTFKEELGIVVH